MTLTLTDLFCGAGGSSSGAEQVAGVQTRIAANHWQLAVDTHALAFPHADHDKADISQTDPRRYPTTDLLWASPECTNHSQAKGRKRGPSQPDLFGDQLPDEAADRSRATMWDVCRFVEAMTLRGHPYKAFVVENVVDVRQWMFFDAWTLGLRNAGYCLHFVHLNSMHAQAAGPPAPQSRDRWYCVGHLRKSRCPDLDVWLRPKAFCSRCDQVVNAVQSWKKTDKPHGRYRAQYVYRCPNRRCRNSIVEPGYLPAAAAIDWALPGQRIGDRVKPLAAKTVARIEAGLRKYARPIHLEAAGNTYERPGSGYLRAWPVDEPLKTVHTTPSKAVAYADGMPFVMRHYTPRGQLAQMSTGADEPMPTQTASFVPALVVPVESRDRKQATSSDEPMRTQTARNETGVAFIAELRGGGSSTRPVTDPLATVTAAGNHHALVMRNNSSKGDGGEMCTPVDEVLRTITTAGHQSLVRWDNLIYDYNGPARSVTDPLPTQTTVEGDALLGPAISVDDCLFRMLEPHEIKAAMAFADDYVLLGNKREKVRLAGNAVTPPAARDLIACVAESLR